MPIQPPSPRRGSPPMATLRAVCSIIAAVLLAAALPAVASAAGSHHHRAAAVHRRAHRAAACGRRAAKRHRAVCRAQRLRHAQSAATRTLPVVTITGGPAAASTSASSSATFSFTVNRLMPTDYCSLDGAASAQCTSPIKFAGLGNGPHSFAVYATTTDGTTSQTVTVGWTVNVAAATPLAPSAPTGLVATPGDTTVALSWSASVSSLPVAAYLVFRNGSQVASTTTPAFTDTGLADGTSYSYAVQAVDSAGNISASSAVVAATPQASPVTPPVTPATPATPAASGPVTQSSLHGSPYQGVQCAPTTPSKSPRLRGTLAYDPTNQALPGISSYLFTLPADTNVGIYPLESCDLVTPPSPLTLGTDGYYGLMVYVPRGWTVPNASPFGVEIQQYHFQNVYGSPISLQLHPDHVTIELETGACSNHTTATPGCAIRSNADVACKSKPTYTCIAGEYAIPPGALVQGAWNEIIMHATWATGYSGDVETWYKTKGAGAWTQSASVSGIPTVQYDVTKGSPYSTYSDITEVYAASMSAPVSVSLANYVTAPTFAAAASQMP